MATVTVAGVRRGWATDHLSIDGSPITVIQVARGMEYDGTTLALVDLAPTMPYVALTAAPFLGHIATGAFLDLWVSDGSATEERTARPCVLSLADATLSPNSDALLLLRHPRIHGTGLKYAVALVGGSLPASSGSCVLFVNAGTVRSDPGSAIGRGGEP